MKNKFALNYRNHNNKNTTVPYQGMTFASLTEARNVANNVKSTTKKRMQVCQLVLKPVNN